MKKIVLITVFIGTLFSSCKVNNALVSEKIVDCIDEGVKPKRELFGYPISQYTVDTFTNFEEYLLTKGYIFSSSKQDYRRFIDDVITNPEKYKDIYDHVYNHDQYLDTKIIYNPDFVLLYCPSTILEKEKNDVLSKQLEIMQNVLETTYGDKESVDKLFAATPSENFKYLAFKIPVMYMVLLKVTQFHIPKG
ncbi:hypothetical protein HME9304_02132 [Flagellimonas maritima]|uniref:Lipoprotein n=1 Tax=Flagellimonas maritima TaxID=1383885 RepID=A0A2Z4LTP4_9FLAO|nr:hypothetical protein [Allomuricauda aurantiaca]AWX45122.1 hypothetical protein HME9304_02132 [Allomuricauda aurantiaca]